MLVLRFVIPKKTLEPFLVHKCLKFFNARNPILVSEVLDIPVKGINFLQKRFCNCFQRQKQIPLFVSPA